MPDKWRPLIKVTLAASEKFMGPGVKDLLLLIEQCGSVRMASERMVLSYSKAWRMLNTLEAQAGYSVVTRHQGGAHGGTTMLTDDGARLLRQYIAFEAECKGAAQALFDKYFYQ